MQTLAPSYAPTYHLDIFVRVIVVGHVVVVASCTIAIEILVIVIVVIAVIVIAVDVGLFGVIERDGKVVGTFPSKPRVLKRQTILLIVGTIGLSFYLYTLSHALREKQPMLLVAFEKILQGKVGELDTDASCDTYYTPSC